MDGATIVTRALSAVGKGIVYKLGKGGLTAIGNLPSEPYKTKDGQIKQGCDCSGFVAWCLRRSRRPQPDFGKWWLSTDSIWSDAVGKLSKTGTAKRIFKQIPVEEMQAGDIVVYPDGYRNGKKLHEGHVAVVVDAGKRLLVDCSSTQNGIKMRPIPVFFDYGKEGSPLRTHRNQVICRYNQMGWE
jgi:cell wall-associated NlpC family hydrolase